MAVAGEKGPFQAEIAAEEAHRSDGNPGELEASPLSSIFFTYFLPDDRNRVSPGPAVPWEDSWGWKVTCKISTDRLISRTSSFPGNDALDTSPWLVPLLLSPTYYLLCAISPHCQITAELATMHEAKRRWL